MIGWRRSAGDHDYRIDSVARHRDRLVVAFSWADRTGQRHQWAQALKLDGARIVDIQDYASPRRAAAATRLRAATAT